MNIKHFVLIPILLFSGLAQASISLGLQAQWQNQQSLAVNIVISGLDTGNAPSLSAYDLDVHFDADQLAYSGITFGDPVLGNQLDLLNLADSLNSASIAAPGVLNLFELSFDTVADLNNLQQDSFRLATLGFSVLQLSTGTIGLTVNSLVDADATPLAVSVSSIHIAPVPVPAAAWLMVSGLMAFAVGRQRR